MIFRDKWGWPIVKLKHKHIANFIRVLVLTDVAQTITYWIKSSKPPKEVNNAQISYMTSSNKTDFVDGKLR